jgi:hypothetical protein
MPLSWKDGCPSSGNSGSRDPCGGSRRRDAVAFAAQADQVHKRRIIVTGKIVGLAAMSLLLWAGFPAFAQQADVSGTYVLEGANPGDAGHYRGEVSVVRTDETFQVRWQIGGQHYLGTGILRDGGFAVVYRPAADQAPGVAFYRIMPNGALSGSWVGLGGKALGSEIWNPRDRL